MTTSERVCRTPQPTRELILDSALSVFGEKGFDGTTTKEIASKAGVNEVTIFRLFGTKGELFDAIMSSRFPYAKISMGVHYDRNVAIETALVDNAKAILSVLREERDLFAILVTDLPRRDRSGRIGRTMLTTSFISPLAAYLSTQVDRGAMRPSDVHLAAQTFFGAIYSYFLLNYLIGRQDGAADDDRYLRSLVQVFLDGVRPTAVEDNQSGARRTRGK